MSSTDILLLDILKHAIRGHAIKNISPSEAELRALLDRAEEQKILPLVFDALSHSNVLSHADKQIIALYQQKALEWVTRQIEQTNEFLVLLHDMQQTGLDPVVMKGLVCRELYPQPMLRTSVDEDLLVDDNHFRLVHDAIVAYGLHPDNDEPNFEEDVEISYHHPSSPLYIELHRRMFAPDQEVYGLFSSAFVDVHQHTMTIPVQDMHIRTLSPTDHVLFLILHAYKHFLYGGVGIRQLCDIGLFAENYGKQIQWGRVVRACEQAGMAQLPGAFVQIMNVYLGIDLTIAHVPSQWKENHIDELPLLDDILTGGLMGNIDYNRMHSSNITLGAVAGKSRLHHSFSGICQSLFPPRSYIESEYSYVKRWPFLLPVGWLNRIFNYLHNILFSKRLSAVATLKIGQERVALLKRYGIIEG